MATVYRKTYTMIMPKNVEIVQRDGKSWAKWTDCNGKKHLDPTTVGRRGQLKIVRFAPTFFAQYRDADGQMVIESTGCRDEQAARHVLAERVKRVEHIKAGILNPQQCRTADHARNLLHDHIDDYLQHLQAKTIRGKRVSQGHRDTALPAQMPLFDMPRSMVGLFDRDLAAASIAKRDDRGRTLDIHALRHTFGTHLSKAGVTPRVAQAAMRHSTLNLTMNIYTDPTLLDVNSAIDALPRLDQAALSKTGT